VFSICALGVILSVEKRTPETRQDVVGMKKAFLILSLSLFGAVAVSPAPGSGSSVVFAQRKDKDDKKNPAGPPVVRPKGGQDKGKEPPPRKDKKPN